MIFRWLSLFLCSTLFALEVEVSASSAILMNADTEAILFEKEAHTVTYPASTTKVGTALFALEKGGDALEQIFTVSEESLRHKPAQGESLAHWLQSDGTMMRVMLGERLSFESLLHGMMLVSGNDAANVIAETLSGSVPQFVDEMNAYLEQIGCLNTQFRNPHGLHHPEHFTTAYDICLMMKRALQNPKFREIVSKTSYWKPKTNKQGPKELKNNNPLMKPGKYFYARAVGAKTGYTTAAMNTLVAAAEYEGRTLIAVVLGCANRGGRYEDVTRLFETAFQEEKKTRQFFGKGHLFSYEMEGAKRHLLARLEENLDFSYYPAEEPVWRAFVRWEVELPVKKGEKVGEVWLCDERERVLQKGNLIATKEVKETFLFMLKKLFR